MVTHIFAPKFFKEKNVLGLPKSQKYLDENFERSQRPVELNTFEPLENLLHGHYNTAIIRHIKLFIFEMRGKIRIIKKNPGIFAIPIMSVTLFDTLKQSNDFK